MTTSTDSRSPGTAAAAPSPDTRRRARLMLYTVLFLGVLTANLIYFLAGLALGRWGANPDSLQLVSALSQLNLLLGSFPRQGWMVNLISRATTAAPVSWPLRMHWRLAQYYQFGGLHVGCAVSGTLWYVIYVVLLGPAWRDSETRYDDWSMLVAVLALLTLVTVSALATPGFRKRHHDIFEVSHRFGGWAVLLLGWINAVLLARWESGPHDAAVALLTSPNFWMLAVSTCLAVWPWLLLRRVPVTVERPSDHAAVVRLGHR